MPEPITLGTIIAALIAKSVSRAEDGAVETGAKVMRKALSTVRSWFLREGDEDGEGALERVVEVPDSPTLVGALAEVLDERVQRSPELCVQLEALKEEAQGAGVDVRSVVQVAIGKGNVQVEAHNSQVNVNQPSSSGSNG